jgi:hypothetical protein
MGERLLSPIIPDAVVEGLARADGPRTREKRTCIESAAPRFLECAALT